MTLTFALCHPQDQESQDARRPRQRLKHEHDGNSYLLQQFVQTIIFGCSVLQVSTVLDRALSLWSLPPQRNFPCRLSFIRPLLGIGRIRLRSLVYMCIDIPETLQRCIFSLNSPFVFCSEKKRLSRQRPRVSTQVSNLCLRGAPSDEEFRDAQHLLFTTKLKQEAPLWIRAALRRGR